MKEASSVAAAINSLACELPMAVALSGGADSTALLIACAEKWPGKVSAVHIHHGLQAAADDFEAHCLRLCVRWDVPLTVLRVNAHAAPGQSPEQAARAARYEAFSLFAQQTRAELATKSIALAHHADDQVETMLLALSRGAGLPGLAAMPAVWQRGGIKFYRPLLGVPASALREWLTQRGVSWIDDPTNSNTRFTRNRIRAQLLPAMQAAFPQFRDTFARSARHAAQGSELLVALAEIDLAAVGSPPVIAALQVLSPARQANVLRFWLQLAHQLAPSTAQLDQLLLQIAACITRGHHIHLKVASGYVLRNCDVLQYVAVSG